MAPALERGLELIELVSSEDVASSFTQLKGKSDIPKATLNRLLKVLCGMDYLAKSSDGKYILGSRCGLIGRPDSIETAMRQYGHDIVQDVCRLTSNTSILFFWNGKQTRVVAKQMHEMSLSMQPVDNVSVDYDNTPWGWIFLECPELAKNITSTISKSVYNEKLKFYHKHNFMLDQQGNMARLAVLVKAGSQTVGALGLGLSLSFQGKKQIIEYGNILLEYAGILSKKLSLIKRY